MRENNAENFIFMSRIVEKKYGNPIKNFPM